VTGGVRDEERDVAVVDLRLPDRLVVRTTSEAAPRRAPGRSGEET
jgi:cell division septal protein FtsQ